MCVRIAMAGVVACISVMALAYTTAAQSIEATPEMSSPAATELSGTSGQNSQGSESTVSTHDAETITTSASVNRRNTGVSDSDGIDFEDMETTTASTVPDVTEPAVTVYQSTVNTIPGTQGKVAARVVSMNGEVLSMSVDISSDILSAQLPDTFCVEEDGVIKRGPQALIALPKIEGFPYQAIEVNWKPYGMIPVRGGNNHLDYLFHRKPLEELMFRYGGGLNAYFMSCDAPQQTPEREAPSLRDGTVSQDRARMSGLFTPKGINQFKYGSDRDLENFILATENGWYTFHETRVSLAVFEKLKVESQVSGSKAKRCYPKSPMQDDDGAPKLLSTQLCASFIPGDQDAEGMIRLSLDNFSSIGSSGSETSSSDDFRMSNKKAILALIIIVLMM